MTPAQDLQAGDITLHGEVERVRLYEGNVLIWFTNGLMHVARYNKTAEAN